WSAIGPARPDGSPSLPEVPEQVGGHRRAQEGGAITQEGDELRQVLEQQPVVERVPEAMGPVEEGQGDEDEEVKSCDRVRREAVEDLEAGCLEPSQGKGQASQKEMHRKEERGDRPPGAEQEPQERRDASHASIRAAARRPGLPRARARPRSSSR